MSSVLHDNFSDYLDDTHPYFVYDHKSYYAKGVAKEVDLFRVSSKLVPRLTNELEVCKTALKEMLEQNFIVRLENFLQEGLHRKEFVGPDELKVYEACGILVGDAGWRETGIEKNIKELLEHTTLRLVFKKEARVFKLSDVL